MKRAFSYIEITFFLFVTGLVVALLFYKFSPSSEPIEVSPPQAVSIPFTRDELVNNLVEIFSQNIDNDFSFFEKFGVSSESEITYIKNILKDYNRMFYNNFTLEELNFIYTNLKIFNIYSYYFGSFITKVIILKFKSRTKDGLKSLNSVNITIDGKTFNFSE